MTIQRRMNEKTQRRDRTMRTEEKLGKNGRGKDCLMGMWKDTQIKLFGKTANQRTLSGVEPFLGDFLSSSKFRSNAKHDNFVFFKSCPLSFFYKVVHIGVKLCSVKTCTPPSRRYKWIISQPFHQCSHLMSNQAQLVFMLALVSQRNLRRNCFKHFNVLPVFFFEIQIAHASTQSAILGDCPETLQSLSSMGVAELTNVWRISLSFQ